MRSVVLLVCINHLYCPRAYQLTEWSSLRLTSSGVLSISISYARAGTNIHELNLFYSLFLGISLVVFGVINMLRVLLDHVACNGAGDKGDGDEMRCCAAQIIDRGDDSYTLGVSRCVSLVFWGRRE